MPDFSGWRCKPYVIYNVRLAALISTRYRAGAQHTRGLRKRRRQNGISLTLLTLLKACVSAPFKEGHVTQTDSLFDLLNGRTASFPIAGRRAACTKLSELSSGSLHRTALCSVIITVCVRGRRCVAVATACSRPARHRPRGGWFLRWSG